MNYTSPHMAYIVSIGFVILVWIAIVALNERYGLLSCDRFSSDIAKWLAYVWLLARSWSCSRFS